MPLPRSGIGAAVAAKARRQKARAFDPKLIDRIVIYPESPLHEISQICKSRCLGYAMFDSGRAHLGVGEAEEHFQKSRRHLVKASDYLQELGLLRAEYDAQRRSVQLHLLQLARDRPDGESVEDVTEARRAINEVTILLEECFSEVHCAPTRLMGSRDPQYLKHILDGISCV